MSTERPTHDEADDGARDETAREAVGRETQARSDPAHQRAGQDEAAQVSAAHDDTARQRTPDTDATGKTDARRTHDVADPPNTTHATHTPDPGDAADTRRRSPLMVASVALAVLLAGGGGAYLATSASGGHGDTDPGAASSGHGNPPPLVLDDYPQGGGASGQAPGTPGIAPGEPDPNGSLATVYRAAGDLPKGPSEAPVYRATGEVSADQVSRLAKALGVAGTPRLSGASWQVGATKAGSGPSLQVTRQAPGTWSFMRSMPGSDNCARGKECSGGGLTGGGTGPAVSEQTAKAAAAPVLKALGQDDGKLDTKQVQGSVRLVNVDPVVGGLPTYGWSTGIRVGTNGSVVGGNGRLVTPVKGETYPVLGAGTTLEMLNKSGSGRMTPKACRGALPDSGQASKDGRDVVASPCLAPSGSHGKQVEVPVQGATFGLSTHYAAGRPTLVPSWLFEARPKGADTGYTLTYPAVQPAYLSGDGEPGDGHGSGAPASPPASSGNSTHVHVTSYTAHDRSLTVHFYGGVCSQYTVAAEESQDKVSVTVTAHQKDPGRKCIMIAKEFTKTVTLDKALGDRKVVDSTGATVREG
ncbi:hypothetical protein [Streptomyces odontomachi]|uniref:hypothetical protein n=1 Tax=Streptomyces odontomachi TaxID=2944940 RepID=UPI00210D9786|nr:hypothetical protein [Streptomyces sp. ODS25]